MEYSPGEKPATDVPPAEFADYFATAASLALARIADGRLQVKDARVTAARAADHPLERSDPWVLGSELSAVMGEEGRMRAWRRIAAMFCWVPR